MIELSAERQCDVTGGEHVFPNGSMCLCGAKEIPTIAQCLAEIRGLRAALEAERARAERAEAKLARVADWACDAGGWQLFRFSPDPPEGVFDLTDQFNPTPDGRLLDLLPAATTGGAGDGEL